MFLFNLARAKNMLNLTLIVLVDCMLIGGHSEEARPQYTDAYRCWDVTMYLSRVTREQFFIPTAT